MDMSKFKSLLDIIIIIIVVIKYSCSQDKCIMQLGLLFFSCWFTDPLTQYFCFWTIFTFLLGIFSNTVVFFIFMFSLNSSMIINYIEDTES